MSNVETVASGARTVTLAELPLLVGQRLGPSRPLTITQEQVNSFAEATGDRQWIHTDPARAARGPFGATIAHGYLTLALQTVMLWDVLEVSDAGSVINYGLNKVRFIAPVPVGSELVMELEVTDVSRSPAGTSSPTPPRSPCPAPRGPAASPRCCSAI